MSTSVRGTAYGAAAYQTLAEVVGGTKRSDPLTPVTLVVPSERVGVLARRALATGHAGSGPGVAGLQVVTLRRFAEVVSGQPLARDGRRPLTGPVLISALREVLRGDPGVFAPVADHIGTARALARAYRELRELPDSVVDGLTGHGEVVAETVRVCRELRRRLSTASFDEVDLLHAARGAVERDGYPGTVVAFLPQDLGRPEQELLATVGVASTLHVVVGMAGDVRADAGPVSTCRALGAEPPVTVEPPVADRVLHASDPDDEVRAVLREVLDALTDHPGYRISVLYGSSDPYARLLHEHCARAGVEVFGRAARPVAESRFGRALLRLLELPQHDFRRDEVLAFVTDAPVRHDGAPAPVSAWERISRTAGVVGGDDWDRLRTLAWHRRNWLADHPDAEQWRLDAARRHAGQAEQLQRFVTTLRAGLTALGHARSWQACADALWQLWSRTLAVDEPDSLPQEDRHALRRIESIIASLGRLDAVAGAPDELLLRQLIELELADELDRGGRIGQGVHIGPVSEAIGDDADLVFVLGAAEGLLPARSSDDPLLPDAVRGGTGGELPTQVQRVARQHRQVLAALAAAPEEGRVAAFSRGDLRSGGTRVPSRWLLPTLRALAGDETVTATRWGEVAGLDEVASYAGALERTAAPATEQEWRQRAAADGDTPDDAILLRAREVRAARASERFTVFDGNLAGERLPDPTAEGAVAATSLESWVHCPHGYFLRHLLGVRPVEQPEQVVRISPLDRGTVQHDILEALVADAEAQGYLPGAGEPWPARAREVLENVATERFRRAEADGVTGFALLWSQDREVLRADLRDWLDRDDERRRELGGLAPVAAEWAFDGAELPLGDGRVLRLRGKIDRIDRAVDGTVVVIDYKTGKPDPYRVLNDDPCDRGQRLQLPIYAVAAGPVYGSPGMPVRSEYWFTTGRGRFERVGYIVNETVMARTRQALRIVVDGLSSGVFPARPNGEGNALYECPACDPDGLGEGTVAATWQRKAAAPEVAPLRRLLEQDAP